MVHPHNGVPCSSKKEKKKKKEEELKQPSEPHMAGLLVIRPKF